MTKTDTLKAHTNAYTTEALVRALVVLDANCTTEPERRVRATMIEVLEERHPALDETTQEWSLSLTDHRTYVQVIVDFFAGKEI